MIPMQRRGLFTLAAAGAAMGAGLAAPTVLRAQTQLRTLADTMAGDSRFSQFLNLITHGSMVEKFRQAAPMTVFAPIDAAFAGAPSGMLDQLLGGSQSGQNRNDVDRLRLGALIDYHTVPGMLRAAELTGDRRLRTVNGSDIALTSANGRLSLQNPAPGQQIAGFGAAGQNVAARPAQVVQADIMASNGIIHAIDQVIWP
ncbi:MAG: fasciclin domain-containing protein [Roseomonas sp.]|nr:fasciclin domain-containing protein [Roseomonas sp.]